MITVCLCFFTFELGYHLVERRKLDKKLYFEVLRVNEIYDWSSPSENDICLTRE